MTAYQAALKYVALCAISTRLAIRFAHAFEETATESQFDEYLEWLAR